MLSATTIHDPLIYVCCGGGVHYFGGKDMCVIFHGIFVFRVHGCLLGIAVYIVVASVVLAILVIVNIVLATNIFYPVRAFEKHVTVFLPLRAS